jgi:hypothetical protein
MHKYSKKKFLMSGSEKNDTHFLDKNLDKNK